jgi:hypothetical protein
MAQPNGTKVFDKDGVWIANLGQYRFQHGTRAEVVFDPHVPTRVKMDDWIASQAPILSPVEDPFGELPESPVIDPNPLISEETGKSVTGVGTGAEGTGNADDARKAAEAAAAAKKAAEDAEGAEAKKTTTPQGGAKK